MFNNFEQPKNKEWVNVMEAMYGIDEVEIEDALIQLEMTRERKFINLKSARTIADHKSLYVNPEAKNDPIFVIFFGM